MSNRPKYFLDNLQRKQKTYNQIGSWYYSGCGYDIDSLDIDSIFVESSTNVMNMYLQQINLFRVSDESIWAGNKSDKELREMNEDNIKLLRRCRRRFKTDEIKFRLESDNYTVSFLIRYFEDMNIYIVYGFIECKEKYNNYIAMVPSNIDNRSSNMTYDGWYQINTFASPLVFILSNRSKKSREICTKNMESQNIEFSFILSVNTALHSLLNMEDYSKCFQYPTHSEMEITMFTEIRNRLQVQNLLCPLFAFKYKYIIGMGSLIINNKYKDIPEYFGNPDMVKSFPLIDLNQKEKNFISNYVKKITVDSGKINLIKYFKNPRYGYTYKLNLSGDKDEEISVIHFDIDEEEEMMRCVISNDFGCNCTHSIILYFNDITDFNVTDNFDDGVCSINIKRCSELYNSVNGLMACPNVLSEGLDSILEKVVKYVISVIISIHDRPERTKIVKAIDKKYYERKEKNILAEEKDFIVVRILKTKQDAREYVSKMSGTRANAEYSVEEWERKGHWRTTKNGNTVWISETTCKRHLPLTEKEIKIKL